MRYHDIAKYTDNNSKIEDMKDQTGFPVKYLSDQQLIGLPVFDSKGGNCGKIKFLCIDPQTYSISGVMIKRRTSPEYFLSVTYFKNVTSSSLQLNSIPIKPGDKVVNMDGKSIGKVIRINLHFETNKIKSLEIKSHFKSKIILSDQIVGIGDKVKVKE